MFLGASFYVSDGCEFLAMDKNLAVYEYKTKPELGPIGWIERDYDLALIGYMPQHTNVDFRATLITKERGMKEFVEHLFEKMGIKLEHGCGTYKGRPLRYFENTGIMEVGEAGEAFERWGNSVEMSFNLYDDEERAIFIAYF
jgi:hypothetical protein